MRILGIESSCDETAAAVVEDGSRVLSNIVASQIDIHAKYGGVVPELASRNHLVKILPVIESALTMAGVDMRGVDGIAVTSGPGLIGALLVGLQTAKAIAYAYQKPLAGVHHVEGHITAVLLDHPGHEKPAFPYIALAVSGGHTALYRVGGIGEYVLIGSTLDDAAGEAFDKVAKLLDIPYPGGIQIDRLSQTGNPAAIRFPRPLLSKQSLSFSFSGIKTAVRYYLDENGRPPDHQALCDLCASFQEAVVEVLIEKTFRAAREYQCENIVVSGGVAANSRLRKRIVEDSQRGGLRIYLTPLVYCTDNAAMVAGLGYHKIKKCHGALDWTEMLSLNAFANVPMGEYKKEAVW
jgi:N6-L-threonylcarbamoyladenine synthase